MANTKTKIQYAVHRRGTEQFRKAKDILHAEGVQALWARNWALPLAQLPVVARQIIGSHVGEWKPVQR